MILEHAILPVIPGQEEEFEAAFAEASVVLSGMPGFIDLTLARSHESTSSYLLLVHWVSIEAHDPGFRTSPEYQQWKQLLHRFYEPFPIVEHFRTVHSVKH
jgi:heme-degrading monooxygenase HmoA